MSLEFTHWPDDLAARYRALGYWLDLPMTEILARSRATLPDAPAILCGERQLSYAELDERSSRLAAHLQAAGLRRLDSSLVFL